MQPMVLSRRQEATLRLPLGKSKRKRSKQTPSPVLYFQQRTYLLMMLRTK
ncbi:unnamed protein product [Amoebophrya sp. A25]|nr:unnamed protein product [Amoebophrya sp. A25]|eukprot:GSA25T00015697001.1